MQGRLFRLIEAGYIVEDGEGYRPTDKIIIPYKKFSAKIKASFKHLDFIRKNLNSPEWSEGYKSSTANEGINYKRINKEIVETAYRKYIDSVGFKK